MATNTTSTNLSPNVASALCYIPLVGFIAAIVLFIVEKNPQVRWNAVQSVLLTVTMWVISFVLGITIILALLTFPLMIVGVILNLILAVRAYQGNPWRLPVLADWVDKIVKKS